MPPERSEACRGDRLTLVTVKGAERGAGGISTRRLPHAGWMWLPGGAYLCFDIYRSRRHWLVDLHELFPSREQRITLRWRCPRNDGPAGRCHEPHMPLRLARTKASAITDGILREGRKNSLHEDSRIHLVFLIALVLPMCSANTYQTGEAAAKHEQESCPQNRPQAPILQSIQHSCRNTLSRQSMQSSQACILDQMSRLLRARVCV